MAIAMEHLAPDTGMDPDPAIQSLHVLSSGTAEQHPEHRSGSVLPQLWWVLTSRRWVQVPVSYFVIGHRDGPVLFDTGLDPAIVSDPGYISQWIGRFLFRRIFRMNLSEEDRLDRKLAAIGVDAKSIQYAVISNLHFDHVGGIDQIPQARLIVSEREWAVLSKEHPEREWVLREHIELPEARWRPIPFEATDDPLFEDFEGVHDVAGDGSMMLLPTPGHTPGSLSMLIRNEGWAPILLVGDLTYEAALLERDITPGTGNARVLKETYAKVRRLRDRLPGLVIVPSHDPAASDTIARAMGESGGTVA